MFALFSDLFAARDTALARCDARLALLVVATLVLAVIASSQVWLPLTVLVLAMSTILIIGLPLRLVAARLAAPVLVVAVLLAVRVWLDGRAGLDSGLILAARVLGACSVVVLLGVIFPAHRIFAALRGLGVPATWVEVAGMMYRYVFVLLDRAGEVASAQRLRLGYTSTRRALGSAGQLAGVVLLRAVDQSARTAAAMRLRGYRGTIPLAPQPRAGARQVMCAALLMLSIAAVWFISERLWSHA